MDLFDTLIWAEILVKTTFLDTPTLTIPPPPPLFFPIIFVIFIFIFGFMRKFRDGPGILKE
jgi:hypothetical protein